MKIEPSDREKRKERRERKLCVRQSPRNKYNTWVVGTGRKSKELGTVSTSRYRGQRGDRVSNGYEHKWEKGDAPFLNHFAPGRTTFPIFLIRLVLRPRPPPVAWPSK
jgi:hypothetical protein